MAREQREFAAREARDAAIRERAHRSAVGIMDLLDEVRKLYNGVHSYTTDSVEHVAAYDCVTASSGRCSFSPTRRCASACRTSRMHFGMRTALSRERRGNRYRGFHSFYTEPDTTSLGPLSGRRNCPTKKRAFYVRRLTEYAKIVKEHEAMVEEQDRARQDDHACPREGTPRRRDAY
jgi:hypothetical protein